MAAKWYCRSKVPLVGIWEDTDYSGSKGRGLCRAFFMGGKLISLVDFVAAILSVVTMSLFMIGYYVFTHCQL